MSLIERDLPACSCQPVGRLQGGLKIWRGPGENGLCSFSCAANIFRNFFTIFPKVVRQHIGVGHADSFQAENSSHFLLLAEIWVAELLEPSEIIKCRVVHPVVTA